MILMASALCHAAIHAAIGPSTPTVSQLSGGVVACATSGSKQLRQAETPGMTVAALPKVPRHAP